MTLRKLADLLRYAANLEDENKWLRAELEEVKKKYDELLTSAVKSAQETEIALVKAVLAGSIVPRKQPDPTFKS